MKIVITPFTIDRYDAVIKLWQECDRVGLSEADSKGNISKYLLRNPGNSFVALSDERVIGAILGGHDGRRGYLHHLAVNNNFRRQGIGQQLVNHSLESLQKCGIDKCHLFIFENNKMEEIFWTSCGWTRRDDLKVISKMIKDQ